MSLRQLVLFAATAALVGCTASSPGGCDATALRSIVRVEVPEGWAPLEQRVQVCVDATCHDGLVGKADDGGMLVAAPAPELDGAARTVHVALSVGPAHEGDVTTHLISPGCQAAMVAAARLDVATGTLQPSTWPR